MKTRIRWADGKSVSRQETQAPIDAIRYHHNLLNTDDAKIEVCFVKDQVSGIVELSLKELERIKEHIREQQALRRNHKD